MNRGNNKKKLECDWNAAIYSAFGRFWEDVGDCAYVCVSLECVTVLGSVQASTQPDGDAGFTLSMTVSSMQQRMRCAKQMDNICSVILKPASGFFFLSDSLFIFFSLALFSPWMKSELSSFSGSPAPFVVIRFCFRVVFTFRISSLPPLFVFPSCLIKPNVWCAPKWLLLSKHFKAPANYIYYVSIASCVLFKSTYCMYLGLICRLSFILTSNFPLQKQSKTHPTQAKDWPGGICVPCLWGCKYTVLQSCLRSNVVCVHMCLLCECWFLLTDKQTIDVVLEKVKVAWVILKWGGWEASPRRYSNGGVIFNFGSIKQDVQPSLPRYLIKYFTHYISFVLPAAGLEW